MPSDALVIGFDTSAAYCAAALLSGDQILASVSQPMKKGQAEYLMPLLEQVLQDAGHVWQDLDAIGVGTGPGNFTGIRIAVSAARGLALALDIPAIGVTTFEATSFGQADPHIPVVAAPRDQVYALLPESGPILMPESELKQRGTPILPPPNPADLAQNIARIAARQRTGSPVAPVPYYIRTADAAPARDAPPLILPDDA